MAYHGADSVMFLKTETSVITVVYGIFRFLQETLLYPS